ncbi:MAG: hypothetical protein ACE5L6_07900 [Candidatus Bathyarchaeia archaeon]
MEIEEMSFEEKYDKLYDQFVLTDVVAWAFVKEMGLTDKYLDYSMKVYKKMMPSLMGSAFKLIKMLAPGRAFRKFVEGLVKDGRVTEPLSNTEVVSLSDREAVIKTKNSLMVKKYRDAIKKAGLKLDLKEYWEVFNEAGKEMVEDFGFDMRVDASRIEEDEVATIIKLKK